MIVVHKNKQNQYSIILTHQVNKAWSLDETRSQWVDLGVHNEACLAQPETCGAAGSAIRLWVKVIDRCTLHDGIISSYAYGSTGTLVLCQFSFVRYASLLFYVQDDHVNNCK